MTSAHACFKDEDWELEEGVLVQEGGLLVWSPASLFLMDLGQTPREEETVP